MGTRFWLGTLALLLALASSLALVGSRFGAASLPGCGPGAGCDRAASSPWGSIPGIGWPTSILGVAWFAGLLIAWGLVRGRAPAWMRPIVLLGTLASLTLLVVMALGGYACTYCILAHVGSLGFALVVLLHRPALPAPTLARRLSAPAFVGIAMGTLAALVAVDQSLARARQEQARREAQQSTRDIEAQVRAQAQDASDEPAQNSGGPRFEGRHRLGPDRAKVRLVMLTDYQCEDCQKIERELEPLLHEGMDLAFSVKHFPLSSDCNPDAPGQFHANACWAARAAEAAGILGGDAGFWKMHHWLFARRGSFTDPELRAGLAELGFDADRFVALMESPRTLDLVKADVEEGRALGVWRTPMVFINGVELRGWDAPGTLTRALRSAHAAGSAAASAAEDSPSSAAEKYVEDWRWQPEVPLDDSLFSRALGPEDSPVRVLVLGDLMEPFTSEVDGLIRLFTKGEGPKVRYAFHHYPVNQSCNPQMPRTIDARSCDAARLTEAAFLAGGPDGFWRAHEWILQHRVGFQPAFPDDLVREAQLDADTFLLATQQPLVEEALQKDIELGRRLGVRAIPCIYVNGRLLERWKARNENILPRVFEAARLERAPDR